MKLIRYEGENVTPRDDAILYRTFLSDGLFATVTPTFTSGAITIPAMRGVMCGRDFTTDAETLTAVLASSGTITGQIYMWIDMEDETYPLSIKIRNSVGSLSDDDINNGGQYYGLEIARYTANTSAVTGVTLTCRIISLPAKDDWQSIYSTLTYASADSPTFVANTSIDLTDRISVGMKLKLTQSTVKYFIVTAITSTTITLYGGTEYTLTSATITDAYFSSVKAPFGFPLDKNKWTVVFKDIISFEQLNPVQDVWYNFASLVVPTGLWDLGWSGSFGVFSTTNQTRTRLKATLSTTNNGETNDNLTVYQGITAASGSLGLVSAVTAEDVVNVSTKTTYYANVASARPDSETLQLVLSTTQPFIIKAVCAYL